jgi:hypothetical protein
MKGVCRSSDGFLQPIVDETKQTLKPVGRFWRHHVRWLRRHFSKKEASRTDLVED